MHFQPSRGRWLAPLLTACAAVTLAACGSVDSASNRLASMVTPYKVEVIQGNFISSEQAGQLKPGMDRAQVRDILGTPLMASVFHEDRWDYVFTLRRGGTEPQQRRFTVFFKGNELERTDGLEGLPSEAEFVKALASKRKFGTAPPLEATEKQLSEFKATGKSANQPPPPVAVEQGGLGYPPLEGSLR